MPNQSVCPTPSKQYFVSKAAAKKNMKENAAYLAKYAPKLYIYHCPCGGFHFTKSQRSGVPRAPLPELKLGDRFKAYIK